MNNIGSKPLTTQEQKIQAAANQQQNHSSGSRQASIMRGPVSVILLAVLGASIIAAELLPPTTGSSLKTSNPDPQKYHNLVLPFTSPDTDAPETPGPHRYSWFEFISIVFYTNVFVIVFKLSLQRWCASPSPTPGCSAHQLALFNHIVSTSYCALGTNKVQADTLTEEQVSDFKEAFSLFVSADAASAQG